MLRFIPTSNNCGSKDVHRLATCKLTSFRHNDQTLNWKVNRRHHQVFSRKWCAATLFTLAIVSGSAAEHRYDFENFEKYGDAGVEQAKQFLEASYPAGGDVQPAVAEITRAGARCQLAYDREDFYFCQYERPGHGLMAFVSTIEWKVVFYVDSETKTKITRIVVGRGATGF